MIQSMTGFGKDTQSFANKKITIEIKSLNSKSADINMRLPMLYRSKELELRKEVSDSLSRGKIDVTIQVEASEGQTSTQINAEVVKSYMEQLRQIAEVSPSELLQMAIRMPDALTSQVEDIDPKEYEQLQICLRNAMERLQEFRTQEGKMLKEDFELRVNNIRGLLEEVKEMDSERSDKVREKLQKAVADIENVDENRFEQELIYYLEKYDVTEEKIRLENHLDYFISSLESSDSNGKKLGFICQEMGREINTLGSKANYAPMQQIVVQMKDELEKIKEQILNVL